MKSTMSLPSQVQAKIISRLNKPNALNYGLTNTTKKELVSKYIEGCEKHDENMITMLQTLCKVTNTSFTVSNNAIVNNVNYSLMGPLHGNPSGVAYVNKYNIDFLDNGGNVMFSVVYDRDADLNNTPVFIKDDNKNYIINLRILKKEIDQTFSGEGGQPEYPEQWDELWNRQAYQYFENNTEPKYFYSCLFSSITHFNIYGVQFSERNNNARKAKREELFTTAMENMLKAEIKQVQQGGKKQKQEKKPKQVRSRRAALKKYL